MLKKAFFSLLLIAASGCYRVPDRIDPRVSYQLQDLHFQKLQSAFPPLSLEERRSDWGKEYIIAKTFAEQLDLYRAVSTFKRAEILMGSADPPRKLEMQYDILLCFFLGKKYDEAIESFENGALAHVDKSFPAYCDLLLVLYECYREMDNVEKQTRILELMTKSYPETAEKLKLSRALREGELCQIETFASGFNESCYLDDLLNNYWHCKKSVATAQGLNALIPGAGYLYIGQKKWYRYYLDRTYSSHIVLASRSSSLMSSIRVPTSSVVKVLHLLVRMNFNTSSCSSFISGLNSSTVDDMTACNMNRSLSVS